MSRASESGAGAPREKGAAKGAAKGTEEATFDQRLDRLEAIVGELEGGDLELEPAIARYKEGVALLGQCREVLRGYQAQVEELTRDAERSLRPYAGDPDAESTG